MILLESTQYILIELNVLHILEQKNKKLWTTTCSKFSIFKSTQCTTLIEASVWKAIWKPRNHKTRDIGEIVRVRVRYEMIGFLLQHHFSMFRVLWFRDFQVATKPKLCFKNNKSFRIRKKWTFLWTNFYHSCFTFQNPLVSSKYMTS